jgi:hypothetical protein
VGTILTAAPPAAAAGGVCILAAIVGCVTAAATTSGGPSIVDNVADFTGPATAPPLPDASTETPGVDLGTSGLEPVVPEGAVGAEWTERTADNGQGIVWQQPGSVGNADQVRIMEPTAQYPNGYVRFYNEYGQPLTLEGNPGANPLTHIPLEPDGSFPIPEGWGP